MSKITLEVAGTTAVEQAPIYAGRCKCGSVVAASLCNFDENNDYLAEWLDSGLALFKTDSGYLDKIGGLQSCKCNESGQTTLPLIAFLLTLGAAMFTGLTSDPLMFHIGWCFTAIFGICLLVVLDADREGLL